MADRYGTLGADSLTGTSGNDYISGGPSANESADTGNDTLRGGSGGSDQIYGWGGDDSIVGSADYSYFSGGVGNDTISNMLGSAYGEAGNDSIVAAAGFQSILVGGSGADTLVSSSGNDLLSDGEDGGGGYVANNDADSLTGGAGIDSFYSFGGADTLDGGADLDYATIRRDNLTVGFRFTPTSTSAAYTASDGTRVVNIEYFEVHGGSGNDTLSGLGGDGILYGNGGNDSINGSNNDDVYGGDGNDTLTASGDYGNLYGGLGADSLVGGVGIDYLVDGNDTAVDTLLGGLGDDYITSGGTGADRIDGGVGTDFAEINRSGSTVGLKFKLGAATAISTASDGMTVIGIEQIRISGGSGRDKLTANAGDDTLTGNDGNDNLSGGKGRDFLDGGEGADTLIGGAVSGSTTGDYIVGGNGADSFRWTALDKRSVDVLQDFGNGPDILEFSVGALGNLLPVGALDPSHFAVDAASAATPQFIFKSASRTLSWDADGTGSGRAIGIAYFANGEIITAADIVIIA